MSQEIARLQDASTEEVLSMVLGEEEDMGPQYGGVVFGRLSHGVDVTEFDVMPRNRLEMVNNHSEGPQGDELDLLSGDDVPAPFESPPPEQFPLFRQALEHFQATEAKPSVVRVDTEKSYSEFVCDRAIEELHRQVAELRQLLEEHIEEDRAEHQALRSMRQWEETIVGASKTIADLRSAKTPSDLADALPQVPLNLPPYAEGNVRCWRDGLDVICSIRFAAADGTPRIATMQAQPHVDVEEVASKAAARGIDPVTILGALPELASAACGKKLLKTVAGAALSVQRRVDVCGMDDEPLLLTSGGDDSTAPLAALMYVEQRAQGGDQQARNEMNKIRIAAQTPSGRRIAGPLLDVVQARLGARRA